MIAADAADGSELRVLVVEDDFLVAKAIEVLLRSCGFTVIGPASTTQEAVNLIKQHPIDVAVLDINLSSGTSEPIARALRYRNCPFLFITGYSNINMLPDDLRGYRILTKPVDRDTLCAAITELAQSMRN